MFMRDQHHERTPVLYHILFTYLQTVDRLGLFHKLPSGGRGGRQFFLIPPSPGHTKSQGLFPGHTKSQDPHPQDAPGVQPTPQPPGHPTIPMTLQFCILQTPPPKG
jgi:hypothetical protein